MTACIASGGRIGPIMMRRRQLAHSSFSSLLCPIAQESWQSEESWRRWKQESWQGWSNWRQWEEWEASQLSMCKLELLPLAVNQEDQPQESAWGDHQVDNQDSCILFLHCHASWSMCLPHFSLHAAMFACHTGKLWVGSVMALLAFPKTSHC